MFSSLSQEVAESVQPAADRRKRTFATHERLLNPVELSAYGLPSYGRLENMVAATRYESAQQAHIVVIPDPSNRHVIIGRHHVVFWIDVRPPDARTIGRNPGM